MLEISSWFNENHSKNYDTYPIQAMELTYNYYNPGLDVFIANIIVFFILKFSACGKEYC